MQNGCTALVNACALGHTDVVKALMQNKSELGAADDAGMTPLMHAAQGVSEAP